MKYSTIGACGGRGGGLLWGLLLACLLASVPGLRAQVSGEAGLWIHGVDFKPEGSMLFVSAVSANWRAGQEPITGYSPLQLPANAFSVYIDDLLVQELRMSRFEDSQVGLDTLLAIDASGSVADHFDKVIQAVQAYVSRRRPGKDQVALLKFGGNINITEFGVPGLLNKYTPFTDDVSALMAFINTPLSSEMRQTTRLFRALDEAVKRVGRGRFDSSGLRVQKTLFLFSDGHNEESGFDVGVPIRSARDNRIQVFCIGVPEPATSNRYHDNLRKIAAETGGVFLPVNDLPSTQAVFERLDHMIKNEYVIALQLPKGKADGRDHILRIQARYGPSTVLSKAITVEIPFMPPPPPPPPETFAQFFWRAIWPWVWRVLAVMMVILAIAVTWRFIQIGLANKRA